MDLLEQKLKEFKHTKAVGPGYPKGYKTHINAYMSGFNSGRYGEYQKEHFVESRKLANSMLEHYNNMIKEDWETAKRMVVDAIINIETEIKKSELLYGENKDTDILKDKRAVLYFICWSLPKLNKEEVA